MADSELKILITATNQAKDTLQSVLAQLSTIQKIVTTGFGGDVGDELATQLAKVKGHSDEARESLKKHHEEALSLREAYSKIVETTEFLMSGWLALKGVNLIQEFGEVAARSQVLSIAMDQLGKRAGYTSQRLHEADEAVQSVGISAERSRQAIAKMIANEIPVDFAKPLAEAARDLSVISGASKDETFSRIVQAVDSGNTTMLRRMGLIIDRQQELNHALAATGQYLDMNQQKQVLANAVIVEAAKIQGAYAAAQGTAGKLLEDMPVKVDRLKEAIGTALLPVYTAFLQALTDIIDALGTTIEFFNKGGEEVGALGDSMRSTADNASIVADAIKGVGHAVADFINAMRDLREPLSILWDVGKVALFTLALQRGFGLVMSLSKGLTETVAGIPALWARVQPLIASVEALATASMGKMAAVGVAAEAEVATAGVAATAKVAAGAAAAAATTGAAAEGAAEVVAGAGLAAEAAFPPLLILSGTITALLFLYGKFKQVQADSAAGVLTNAQAIEQYRQKQVQLLDLQKQIDGIEKQRTTLTYQNVDPFADHADLNKRIDELQRQADELKKQKEGAEKQASDLKAELDHSRGQGAMSTTDVAHYQKVLDLQQQIAQQTTNRAAAIEAIRHATENAGLSQVTLESGITDAVTKTTKAIANEVKAITQFGIDTEYGLRTSIGKMQGLAGQLITPQDLQIYEGGWQDILKTAQKFGPQYVAAVQAWHAQATAVAQAAVNKNEATFTGGGAEAQARLRQAEDLQTKTLTDALNHQIELIKTAAQEEAALDKLRYEQGLMTLDAYYKARQQQITRNGALEYAQQQNAVHDARVKYAQVLRENNGDRAAPQVQAQQEAVVQAESRLTEVAAKTSAQAIQQALDQYHDELTKTQQLNAIVWQNMASHGDLVVSKLAEVNAKYDELEKKLGSLATAEEKKALADARQLEQAKAAADASDTLYKRQIDLQNAAYGLQEAQIGRANASGALTDVEAQERRNTLIQERIKLDEQQIDREQQALELAKQANDTDDIAKRTQAIVGLQTHIETLSTSIHNVGDDFRKTFVDGLANAFGQAASGAERWGNAMRGYLNDLKQQMMSTFAKNAVQNVFAGMVSADGQSGPMDAIGAILTGSKPASRDPVEIGKTTSRPMYVSVVNLPEERKNALAAAEQKAKEHALPTPPTQDTLNAVGDRATTEAEQGGLQLIAQTAGAPTGAVSSAGADPIKLAKLAELERAHNLPAGTLKGIWGTESTFGQNTGYSSAGAFGNFQQMPDTAKQYNVKLGDFNSEAEGAAQQMEDLLKKNDGNLDKALGAYGGFVTKDPSGYISKVRATGGVAQPTTAPTVAQAPAPAAPANDPVAQLQAMANPAAQVGPNGTYVGPLPRGRATPPAPGANGPDWIDRSWGWLTGANDSAPTAADGWGLPNAPEPPSAPPAPTSPPHVGFVPRYDTNAHASDQASGVDQRARVMDMARQSQEHNTQALAENTAAHHEGAAASEHAAAASEQTAAALPVLPGVNDGAVLPVAAPAPVPVPVPVAIPVVAPAPAPTTPAPQHTAAPGDPVPMPTAIVTSALSSAISSRASAPLARVSALSGRSGAGGPSGTASDPVHVVQSNANGGAAGRGDQGGTAGGSSASGGGTRQETGGGQGSASPATPASDGTTSGKNAFGFSTGPAASGTGTEVIDTAGTGAVTSALPSNAGPFRMPTQQEQQQWDTTHGMTGSALTMRNLGLGAGIVGGGMLGSIFGNGHGRTWAMRGGAALGLGASLLGQFGSDASVKQVGGWVDSFLGILTGKTKQNLTDAGTQASQGGLGVNAFAGGLSGAVTGVFSSVGSVLGGIMGGAGSAGATTGSGGSGVAGSGIFTASDNAGAADGMISGFMSIASALGSLGNSVYNSFQASGSENPGAASTSTPDDLMSGYTGHATGGLISGAGTGTSDSIHAMLSHGEYVMPARQTSMFGGLLESMRSGALDHLANSAPSVPSSRKYATGGYVSVPVAPTSVLQQAQPAAAPQVQLNVHPDALGMTMSNWLEGELGRIANTGG